MNTNNRGEEWPWTDGPAIIAYFPDISSKYCVYQGWFEKEQQYLIFAALVFAHRNRDHPDAEAVRASNPHLTDQQIVALQKGWQSFNWISDTPVSVDSAPIWDRLLAFMRKETGAFLLFLLFYGGAVFFLTRFFPNLPHPLPIAILITTCVYVGAQLYEPAGASPRRKETRRSQNEAPGTSVPLAPAAPTAGGADGSLPATPPGSRDR